MSATRGRMMSDVRLIQEAMPGLLAADSLAYVLGHLVGQDGIQPMAWRRALIALGQEFPERQAMMDAALAGRSSAPLLRMVDPDYDGPWPPPCSSCQQASGHAPWCPSD